MTTITIERKLLEQALNALTSFEQNYGSLWYSSYEPDQIDSVCSALRTVLAAPDDVAEEMSAVADQYAHKLALDLECVLADYSGTWYDAAIGTLGAYRGAMNAIHERESPTFMGEPVIRPTQAAPATVPEKCGHCGRRTIDPPWPIKPSTDDRHAQELLAQDITIANMQERHAQELCAYQITVDKLRAERKPMGHDDAVTCMLVFNLIAPPSKLLALIRAVEAHHGIVPAPGDK